MSRMNQILQMLENDPDDVFLNFSLAMEYAGRGRLDEAVAQFARVVQLDPYHVASFYQWAQALVNADRPDEARTILERGEAAARRAGDRHMLDKITQMRTLLG